MTAEVAAEAQDEPVYCICRGPEAGFMVFCDGCEEWFHGDCVGIKKRQADKLDKYLCPNCAPPVEKNAKPQTPDSETSKSRSGRSIRKKKWDEEEYEYDFKNKEEDEDYEDEEEEDRPQKPAPKRMAPQPHQQQQHIQRPLHAQHGQHVQHPQHPQHQHLQQHMQHPQHPQHSQHQIPSQQIPSYMSHNNHFTHSNHLNLMGQAHPLSAHPISNHLNINPTIQAINSINHYLHAPAPLGNPNPNPILPHPLNAPTSLSGIQGASPGSKRSFASTSQQPGPPKASPEPKPKMVRRESFPPGGKGDKKEKEKEKEKDPVKEKEAEETVRRNARNNLSEALGNPTIAIAIEAEMFKQFPIKAMSKEYTAKARSLLFNLRDPKNATLKERTLSGAITPQRFVSMRPEEYASGELAEWRRQQEAKAMQSISILPEEDEEAQAQKLNEMVQRQIEAEQKAADGNGAVNGAPVKSEDVGKYLSREGEEEDSVKKEKELVDIDINIADNPNLAAPLALPLPLPIPTPGAAASLPLPPLPSANAAAAATAASTTLITPLPPSVSVPIWKGEFDKIAVGVEPFSVRGYHLGGPHVDTLLARVASVTARGKLEVTKLSDYITEKIDSSPHRTRSLILIEPAATNDDEAYEMTWEYCNNNRSPAVVCGITPPVPEDEEATVPRLDQMYIVPLATPEEIPDFLFPPNMTSSARKINLRAAGQRSSARNCYMLAIVVTKLPDPSKKSKPETPSRADSPNPNPVPIPSPSPNPNPNAPLLPNPPISPSSMNPIFNSPPHTQPPQQAQQQAHQQQMYNMQQQAQYGNQQGPNYNLPSPSQMYQQNNMYQQQNPNFPQFQNNYQQFNNSNNFPPHQPLPPPIFNPGNNQFFNQYNNNFQQQNYKP